MRHAIDADQARTRPPTAAAAPARKGIRYRTTKISSLGMCRIISTRPAEVRPVGPLPSSTAALSEQDATIGEPIESMPEGDVMDVQFIASVAVITPDPSVSRRFYVDALGLPLTASADDDYLHSEDIDGCKSFGVWP